MARTLLLFAITACAVIGLFSFAAVHVEAMIYKGSMIPTSILPIDALRGHGISWGLVIASGLGAVAHDYLFRQLFVRRWRIVDESDFNRLHGKSGNDS
ncbi:MAG TPA: hypothetical protein VLT62_21085, partial [Candidatus Methylomirabilis sp.]|nr:hypothetical protein [Candidatus Methylomirabilis sp.]